MATKAYYKPQVVDAGAFTWDTMTGIATYLGSGRMTIECATAANDALSDDWQGIYPTRKKATFEGELAAAAGGDAWWTKIGDSGTIDFQANTVGTVSGTFYCTKAEMVQGDALRWNVTLEGDGTITLT